MATVCSPIWSDRWTACPARSTPRSRRWAFAYSLQVFFPAIPIALVAVVTVAVFTVLNITGVASVGNAQIILGLALLGILLVYVGAGLFSPRGFQWTTFAPGGSFFVQEGVLDNLARILRGIALVYMAYVGFEVIADDAEEAQNPSVVIPRGILISLTLVDGRSTFSSCLATLGTRPLAGAGRIGDRTDRCGRALPAWMGCAAPGVWEVSSPR